MNYLLIDIGNSAVKLGFFNGNLPRYFTLPRQLMDWDGALLHWFWSIGLTTNESRCHAHVSCVCPELWDRLRPLLSPALYFKYWEGKDVPIEADVDDKNAIGTDRLFAALYVSTIKTKKRPALVCNVGTAQTVDVISQDGIFLGGQIVPGLQTSLDALNMKTALLPKIENLSEDLIAKSDGKNTRQAMEFGAINLACGMLERIKRLVKKETNRTPAIYISGGAGKLIWKNLGSKARYVEQMTLKGMYVAATTGKELRERKA